MSQDRRTMQKQFARFTAAALRPGVVLLQETIPIAIKELILIWSASEAEAWTGKLGWIPL